MTKTFHILEDSYGVTSANYSPRVKRHRGQSGKPSKAPTITLQGNVTKTDFEGSESTISLNAFIQVYADRWCLGNTDEAEDQILSEMIGMHVEASPEHIALMGKGKASHKNRHR